MPPITFSIHYSAAHGYETAALALARRLFAEYDTGIDALSLVPTANASFALYFNDQLIESQERDGREPAVADVRALLHRERIVVTRRPGPEEGADEPDE